MPKLNIPEIHPFLDSVGRPLPFTEVVKALRQHEPKAYLDVHLCVTQPAQYLEELAQAGLEMNFGWFRRAWTPWIDGVTVYHPIQNEGNIGFYNRKLQKGAQM